VTSFNAIIKSNQTFEVKTLVARLGFWKFVLLRLDDDSLGLKRKVRFWYFEEQLLVVPGVRIDFLSYLVPAVWRGMSLKESVFATKDKVSVRVGDDWTFVFDLDA